MTWLCVMAVLAAAPEAGEVAAAPATEATTEAAPAAEAEEQPAPAKPEKKKELKLGAPTFASANVTPEVTNVASEHFAQQLSLQGLRVITNSEIAALLGMERQKALLGCADDTSCMVELSNALGVDGVVTGSLGSFGGRYTVNVKVVGAADGRQLGVFSATAESERGLPDLLSRAAHDIAKQVKLALGWEEAPTPQVAVARQTFTQRQRWAAAPASLAVALFVAGGVLLGFAENSAQRLTDTRDPPNNVAHAFSLVDAGKSQRLFGGVAIGAGGAAVAAAAWLFFFGNTEVKPTATLTPDGVSIGLGGTLPW